MSALRCSTPHERMESSHLSSDWRRMRERAEHKPANAKSAKLSAPNLIQPSFNSQSCYIKISSLLGQARLWTTRSSYPIGIKSFFDYTPIPPNGNHKFLHITNVSPLPSKHSSSHQHDSHRPWDNLHAASTVQP